MSKNYQEWLLERLKNPHEALAYLQAALKESKESPGLFQIALDNVKQAHKL